MPFRFQEEQNAFRLMIYLVTNNPSYQDCELYTLCTVEQSLKMLEPLKLIGYDSETEGLDCHSHKMLSMQFGCEDWQVVVDCRTIDPLNYKALLESKDKLFLGWNLKFDLKFLFTLHIVPYNMYDGMLAEKLLWLGYPKKMHSLSLKSAGFEYLGVELDKSIRGQIIWKGLVNDVIEYAANDVKYLEALIKKQREKLKEQDLLRAIDIENKFLLPVSYMEWCGVRLDVDKWHAKMAMDNLRMEAAKKALNDWLINDFKPGCKGLRSGVDKEVEDLRNKYVFIDAQGDLWNGFNTEPQTRINWNSGPQVLAILKLFDTNIQIDDKKNGGLKDSKDKKVLVAQKDKCSLIPIYLEYSMINKIISTYGENIVKQIHKDTGRLYTNFNQMGTNTARVSSGGDDCINFLNLPKNNETRNCFIAEPGNKWISIDHNSQESVLMASISGDEAIIKEFTEGSGDLHSLTAYMSYSEIPRDTPIKDIKKLYPELRQESKGIEFACSYGGNAYTISKNKGIPIETANEIYKNYTSGFKGLKIYQDFRRKDWMNKGYIPLNPLTGHKSYVWNWEEMKRMKKKFSEPGFRSYYNDMKKEALDCDIVQSVNKYFRDRSKWENRSIDYPIQGTGAMCIRHCMIMFFNWLREKDYLFKVLLTVLPYDESNCEAPEEIAEEVASKLYECMVEGGKPFSTRCPLDASTSRLPDGTLPNYWIH